MARVYRTLSLSLPPEAARALERRGRAQGVSGARVAARIVLADLERDLPGDAVTPAGRVCAACGAPRLRTDLEAEHGTAGHPAAEVLWRAASDLGSRLGSRDESSVRSYYGYLAELGRDRAGALRSRRSRPAPESEGDDPGVGVVFNRATPKPRRVSR